MNVNCVVTAFTWPAVKTALLPSKGPPKTEDCFFFFLSGYFYWLKSEPEKDKFSFFLILKAV